VKISPVFCGLRMKIWFSKSFFFYKKINEEISNIQILAANINMIGKIDMPKHKAWHSSGMFPQATHAII
jgi:hypothetical protein